MLGLAKKCFGVKTVQLTADYYSTAKSKKVL
jgi:hypothetical protein